MTEERAGPGPAPRRSGPNPEAWPESLQTMQGIGGEPSTPGVSLRRHPMRISEQGGHSFRSKVATQFGAKWPPVSVWKWPFFDHGRNRWPPCAEMTATLDNPATVSSRKGDTDGSTEVVHAQDQGNSIGTLMGLDIRVPDYSTLSRRANGVSIAQVMRQAGSVPIHLVVDSTGLKIFGEGE